MNLTDDNVKSHVVRLRDDGHSHREISKLTGIPKTNISCFLKRNSFKDWWSNNNEKEIQTIAEKAQGAKILIIDIETSPIKCLSWGLFKQNIGINQITEDWHIMLACAKWLDEDQVITLSAEDYWKESDPQALEDAVTALWVLLDEADIIVAHNGVRFDNKKIRAKLKEYGLPPPSPYKVVDTMIQAKQQFGFTSNKLDYIAKKLVGEGKKDTGGMQLWVDCMDGDDDAWRKMEDYCQQDVLILEEVYKELRGWDNKHPNVQMYYDDDKDRCGVCGSENLSEVKNKFTHTGLSTFALVRCDDCGSIRRGRENLRSKEQMKHTTMNVM